MHMTQSMYTPDPNFRAPGSVFSIETQARYREQLKAMMPEAYSDKELRNVADALKQTFDTSKHVFGSLKRLAQGWMGRGGDLALPWMDVPRSSINTPVDGARRFVAQSWPFERIRAVGKSMDGTFNDAVLAMCAGALRTYMLKHSELPEKSLKAMVPVSLREKGDIDSANAVGAISADLGTNISDPIKRFQKIQGSMVAGKELFKGLKPKEAALMLQLLQAPGLLIFPLGLMSKFPPFSTVISNVPGPRHKMYWQGASLEGLYPASIVTEGIALNITLVSYNQQVDFGITACRRSMPQVQRLIDYMDDALIELEQAAGVGTKPPTTGTSKANGKKPVAKKSRSKKVSKKVAKKTAKKSVSKKTGLSSRKKTSGKKTSARKVSAKSDKS
jgi:WS/DGAT/MGAT family acyltransferase